MAALRPENRNASQTNKPAPRRSRNARAVSDDVEALRRRVEELELENALMREVVKARRKRPRHRAAEHAVAHGPHGVSIPAGKAYLSPVIDCYDGMPVARTIGTSPDSALANGMLADACSTLKDGEKPIIHPDRGCHYRWPKWIRIRKDNNLTRRRARKAVLRTTPPRRASSAGPGRSSSTSAASRASRWTGSSTCSTTTWSGTGTRGSRRSPDTGIMDRRRRLGLVA